MMLDHYIDWVRNIALATWAERGFDHENGRFRERLDWNGEPLAVPHRSMVQARQIFVFAHAAQQGWSSDGTRLAELAMAKLISDFALQDGQETSFAFSIDPASGAIVSSTRDAYAHAFILFSIAALFQLNGDPKLLELADRTIAYVERRLGDPVHGGLFDALPAPAVKRQNPHMHLLETYLFLERAAPGRGYIDRAGALVRLLTTHFIQQDVLLEYFVHDWTAADHAVWEPGHHFEWVWLLDEYAQLSGQDMRRWGDNLYDRAVGFGLNADRLVVEEVTPGNRIVKASHRVWPHTEAIKAAATRHASGDPAARAFAEDMAAGLNDIFLDKPFVGGWIDQVEADRTPLSDTVPASTLYHLVLAASVAAKGFASAPSLAKAQV